MKLTPENIDTSNNDKPYLQDLLREVKNNFEYNRTMTFKIIEPKENGFIIKVGGLYGFIYYRQMPWKYNSIYFWHNVAEYLVGKVFSCKIRKLKKAPISIIITARE